MNGLATQHAILITLTVMGLTACTTRETNSELIPPNLAQQLGDQAQIHFDSDYARETTFQINTGNVIANACRDFKDIDYAAQLAVSPGTTHKVVSPTVTSVSGVPIAITARHFVEAHGLFSTCGPLTRVFVPEANTQYVARLLKERDMLNGGEETGLCVLDIQQLDAGSAQPTSIRTIDFSPCALS